MSLAILGVPVWIWKEVKRFGGVFPALAAVSGTDGLLRRVALLSSRVCGIAEGSVSKNSSQRGSRHCRRYAARLVLTLFLNQHCF